MANYCCTVRTNYFHVKDEDKFKDLMSRVYGCEDEIQLWERKDQNGKTTFGFGAYGGIAGLRSADDEDEDDNAYDEFLDGLRECVADNDAIIIMEVGNEKMRYVVGAAEIITSKKCEYIEISELAAQKAAEMIGVTDWTTQLCY